MQTLPETYAFVDVETTGGMAGRSRILEMGIWRVEKGQIVDSLDTLIDPGEHVPPEITRLTGIQQSDIESAPTFRSIAGKVVDLLEGAIFVAHNARFDYAFVRSELRRLGVTLSRPTLCTVKLFRQLAPEAAHHNLDALMTYYDLECTGRHRAAADARVLVDFFQRGPVVHGPGFWDKAAQLLKRPSWPIKLTHLSPADLPESPGVYIFKDDDGAPLYIGKAKNIRDRVVSHFLNDIDRKELRLAAQVADIETMTTAGEMGALLLESQLIKQQLPVYNRQLRKNLSMVGAFEHITPEGYKTIELRSLQKLSGEEVRTLLGVFRSKKAAIDYFRSIAEQHHLCPQTMGLVSGTGACFWRQLEMCDGACDGKCPVWKYNATFDGAMRAMRVQTWPFPGAIALQEPTVEGQTSSWIVQNWCLVGHETVDTEGNRLHQDFSGDFDWDAYKIIRSFIRTYAAKPVNMRKLGDDWTSNS